MTTTPPARDAGLDIPPDVLAVDPEAMRRLGYAMVDRTKAHLIGIDAPRPIQAAEPAALDAIVGGQVPTATSPTCTTAASSSPGAVARSSCG